MEIRILQENDIKALNKLQAERGYNEIGDYFNSSECRWVIFGAFDNDELVSVVGLFPYKRMPHADYPSGSIAELGGLYTKPEYRRLGIGTKLVSSILEYAKKEMLLDAIVADSTENGYNITNKFGFEDSTEHRQWLRTNK